MRFQFQSRDCLILSGREFQIWGPETAKARWPNVWSRNLGTTRSPREADRRHCRPTAEPTGWHSSIRYSGAAPTKQWRTIRAILKSILLLIGSQWVKHVVLIIHFFMQSAIGSFRKNGSRSSGPPQGPNYITLNYITCYTTYNPPVQPQASYTASQVRPKRKISCANSSNTHNIISSNATWV